MPTGPSTSRLYDDLSELWALISPPEDYPEEVAGIRELFRAHGLADGASVLHLGSGGGSVDFHLKENYRVTGLDISRTMLEYARGVNPEVEYVEGDMRTARLGRTFDGVLVHDAIAYVMTIEEVEQVYRTAAAHLAAGGVMVCPPEQVRNLLRPKRPSVTTREVAVKHAAILEIDNDEDPADHVFEKALIFVIREAGGLRVEVDRHVMGIFELEEFLDAMRRAGLDVAEVKWERFEGDEYPLVAARKR